MADTKNITITKVSEAQKKKRLEIQNLILQLMDDIELSEEQKKNKEKSYNREQWEKKFAAMSNLDFHKFMEKIAKDKSYGFSYEANTITSKNKLSIKKIEKIAEKYNVKLAEYVIFPDKNRSNPETPIVSRTPLPILVITVKRLQQMLSKKNKISSDNSSVNPVSGQVTGDSKGGRLSNTQTFSLVATNQLNSVKEFLSVRSDDEVAKRMMLKEIEQTGKAHLSNYDLKTSNKQAIQAMEAFLRASGLYSNILRSDKLPVKSKEDITNEFKFIKDKDISSYKLTIFGYRTEKELSDICNKIKEIKPELILTDLIVPGEIIDRPKASQVLLNNATKFTNHLNETYNNAEILDLVTHLNNKAVSIAPFNHDLEKFHDLTSKTAFIENKYLNHIQQYNSFDDKISVIIYDDCLRYLPTGVYKIYSPIIEKYKFDENVLIIRSNIDDKEERLDTFKQLKERIYFKQLNSIQYNENNKRIRKIFQILMDVKGIDETEENPKPLYIGKVTLISNIEYKRNNVQSILILDPEHESGPSVFATIEFDEHYKNLNFEDIIVSLMKSNSDFPSILYSLVSKDNILAQNYKSIPEFEEYLPLPSDNYICVKIKE